jgi:hypothetical protein
VDDDEDEKKTMETLSVGLEAFSKFLENPGGMFKKNYNINSHTLENG